MLKLRKTSGTYKDFGKSFMRYKRTSFTTIWPSLSLSLTKRPQISISPSLNSIAVSTNFQPSQMARSGLFDSHSGPYLYRCLVPYWPAKLGHLSKVSKQVLYPKKDERNRLNTHRRGTSNKNKRSRSFVTGSCRVKVGGGPNNLSVTYMLFNDIGGYTSTCYERNHKCKKCGSQDHRLAECTSKWRIKC